jgi:endonuclease/exonuclease/phosphatase family metal-dependent hydrolase
VQSFLHKFGFILNIVATALLLLAYLAPYIPPDSFWPLALFGLAFPYILLLNLFFLVLWSVQKSKKLLLPLLAILLGIGHFNAFFQLTASKKDKGNGIKILSYNVNYFSYDLRNKQSQSRKLLEYLKSSSSDIICLQETYLAKSGDFSPKGIMDALPKINFYQLAHAASFGGPVTFSRYPIIEMGEIRFSNSSNMVLFSDIKISDAETIRVYNCHFQSYQIKPEDYTIIESPGSGSNRLKLKEVFELGHKLITAFSIRAYQARKVAGHIKNCPYPVVVCGDFNDTPCSYTYRKVLGNMKDSFVESGFGISNTYHGILPSFRIDYILHTDKYYSHNYQRDRVVYSDHYPIFCVLEHN